MKTLYLFLFFLSFSFCQARGNVNSYLSVIVHPSNHLIELKQSDIVKIFLEKVTHFPNGEPAIPRDQEPGIVKELFYRAFFDYSLEEINDYWIREVYRGGVRPPNFQETKNDREMIAWIASNPAGIGYVQKSALTSSVKEILVTP